MSKLELSTLLPAATLDLLVVPYAALHQCQDVISILHPNGQTYFGPAQLPGSPLLTADIVVRETVLGKVALAQTELPNGQELVDYLATLMVYSASEKLLQREMGEEVINRYDEINLIYELSVAFSRSMSYDDIVSALLEEAMRIAQGDAGVVYRWQGRTLEPVISIPVPEDGDDSFWRGSLLEQARSSLMAYEGAYFFDNSKVVCVPLRTHSGDTLGSLLLMYQDENRSFNSNLKQLLNTLAQNTSLFIQLANLYESLQQRNLDLETALADLRAARAELSRSERLSIIGQTVAGLVHDMRKPLSIMMGYAGLLREEDIGTEERLEFAGQIIKYVDVFSSMAQDILDYTQGDERIEKKLTQVETYLAETSDLLAPPGLSRAVQIIVDAAAVQNVYAMLDKQRFTRVFQNLVNNAVDAIENNSGSQVVVSAQPQDGYVRFAVTDDGPGVPADKIDTIFEPFVTFGKPNGFGLGLPIVRRIVEAHGGTLHYETAPNGGASFVIMIPMVDTTAVS